MTTNIDTQNIEKNEIDIFHQYAGQIWEAGNPDHTKASEKLKLLYEKLDLIAEKIGRKVFNENYQKNICVKRVQDQATPLKFKKYLWVRVLPRGKYSDLAHLIIFLDKRAERTGSDTEVFFCVGWGFTEDSLKKNRKKIIDKAKILNDQKVIFSKLVLDRDFSVPNLVSWAVDEINRFDVDYDQFCNQFHDELDEILDNITIDSFSDFGQERSAAAVYQPLLADDVSCGREPENTIFYGPPGTGKTFRLQDLQKKFFDRCKFVTFHQSYGYEEFVEGLRPVLIDDEHSDTNSSGGKDVKYKIEPGIFKQLCDRAREDPQNGYAIFIDEINRGNISKIFGELITLIELDKRSNPESEQEQQFQVSLAYSKKPFTVPANVSIIGSMNTADRSLALIDTALRRRFEFKELYPDTREEKVDDDKFSAPLAGLMVASIDIRRMLECINERIEILYDRDHCIGHAYFTGLINKDESTDTGNKFEQFRDIFFNRIKPLLEEYFFDDWEKIGRVLGDHLKKESRLQFLKKLPLPKDLWSSDDNPDDSKIFLRPRYRWNDNAFSDPEAYIGIYSQS